MTVFGKTLCNVQIFFSKLDTQNFHQRTIYFRTDTNNNLNAWFPCTQADYATAATSQTVTRAPSIAPSTADSTFTTISREELKGALLSVMARKDELAGRLLSLTNYDICPEF